MGLTIEDGTGKGYSVAVREDGKLNTYTVAESPLHYRSTQGRGFIWQSVNYNYIAGDTILWIRNDSPTYDIILDTIYLYSDVLTEATLHFPTGTSPSGTSISAEQFNRSLGITPDVTAYSPEASNTQGDVFLRLFVSANTGLFVPLKSSLILGTNNEFAVDFAANGSVCSASFWGYVRKIGD